jgi:hypothetical protein
VRVLSCLNLMNPNNVELRNEALRDLAQMFLSCPSDPTIGCESIDVSRFDFTIASLAAMDEHLETMRIRGVQGDDLIKFVLRAGAYVGEVIRRCAPSTNHWDWVDYDQAIVIDPRLTTFGKALGSVAMLWDRKLGFTFPLAKVGKYLQNGPEDSVRFYAQVIIANSRGPLHS